MHGTEDGKTKYRNQATGATLQYDSGGKRWVLGLDNTFGFEIHYSSLANAYRDVPWNEDFEMSGTSWQFDEGHLVYVYDDSASNKLGFKGMQASTFYVLRPPKICIGMFFKQLATPHLNCVYVMCSK